MGYILLILVSILFWPTVIGVIIYFVFKNRKKNSSSENKGKSLTFSKEDTISQLLILVALSLMWVFLLSVDKQLGNPISWKSMLLLSVVISFGVLYYYKVLFVLPFAIVNLGIWWGMQSYESNKLVASGSKTTFIGILLFMLVVYCVGRLHELWPKWKRYSSVYVILSLFGLTFSLFFISTQDGLSYLDGAASGVGSVFSMGFILLFLLLIVGAVAYGFLKEKIGKLDATLIFGLWLLFVFLSFISPNTLFIQSTKSYAFFYDPGTLSDFGYLIAFILNVLLLAELIGLIFLGYVRRETWLITFGSIFTFFYIFVKYVDWFFSFMDKSLFFLGAGILLFGLGWLMEKGRKKMIQSMNENSGKIEFFDK